MRKLLSTALFLFVIGLVSAQSPSLRFDPAWKWAYKGPKPPLFPSPQLPATHPIPEALPMAWQYNDLAFFCKIEVKMEKAARFPIKFRLGDVQYVERLEGKLPSY
jgi:hypothetical protein